MSGNAELEQKHKDYEANNSNKYHDDIAEVVKRLRNKAPITVDDFVNYKGEQFGKPRPTYKDSTSVDINQDLSHEDTLSDECKRHILKVVDAMDLISIKDEMITIHPTSIDDWQRDSKPDKYALQHYQP